ncbi:MAG: protein kinase [archaeon]|nr:protein kinase [archaeon]
MGNFNDCCCRSEEYKKKPFNISTETENTTIQSHYDLKKEEETDIEQIKLLKEPSKGAGDIKEMHIKTKNVIQKNKSNVYEVYELIKDISEGSFGKAQVVRLRSNPKIERALKIIPKVNINKAYKIAGISSEIDILRRLDHPYIVKIYEFFEDEKNYYFVNEYCPDGDLANAVYKNGPFTEISVKHFLFQILQAVAYLHDNKVVHGDIKPENILIDNYSYGKETRTNERKLSRVIKKIKDNTPRNSTENVITFKEDINMSSKGPKKKNSFTDSHTNKTYLDYAHDLEAFHIKIIDFGCSKIFNKKQKMSGLIGTSLYCSPEVIKNSFDDNCDEWSCGILAYYLLYKKYPFQGRTEKEIFDSVMKNPLKFPKNSFDQELSYDCKDLIKKLLEKDSEKRIKAKDALNHIFFDEIKGGYIETGLDLNEQEELKNRLEILKNYKKSQSKFKEFVIAYLTLNFLNKKEEVLLQNFYNYFEKTDDVHITKEDFMKFMIAKSSMINKTEINMLFDQIDSDKNGFIEFQELARALGNKQELLTEANLKSAFDFFDTDKSGDITCEELCQRLFMKNGEQDVIFDDFLEEIGKKRTDTINFEEFKNLILEEDYYEGLQTCPNDLNLSDEEEGI